MSEITGSDYDLISKSSTTTTSRAMMGGVEVARDLGVSMTEVRRMVERGELAYLTTFGGHRRYFRDEVLELVVIRAARKKGLIRGR